VGDAYRDPRATPPAARRAPARPRVRGRRRDTAGRARHERESATRRGARLVDRPRRRGRAADGAHGAPRGPRHRSRRGRVLEPLTLEAGKASATESDRPSCLGRIPRWSEFTPRQAGERNHCMPTTDTERSRPRVDAAGPSPLLSALRLATGISYSSVEHMHFGLGDLAAERKHERRNRLLRVRP
jgi:hypothetical protein